MNLDLSELRKLADEAWPGPWEKFGNTVTLKINGGIVHTIVLPGDHQTLTFIAASRTAVPALIDEIERVTAERDEWKAKFERLSVAGEAYFKEARTENKRLSTIAAALVEDVEALARVFHFVVPANASKIRAVLAGKHPDEWQDFRDPSDPTQVC